MDTPHETHENDAYTALHFSVFAATSQLAPAFMSSVQRQTQRLLGRPVRMDEVKEVMANSKEDLKRALCGISSSNRFANCTIATTNFTMGAPLWDCDRDGFPALPHNYTLPKFDRFTSKDGDLLCASEVADPESKDPVQQNDEHAVVMEPEIVKEKEENVDKEAVVPEKSVDVSLCHAELDITDPKSSDEMIDYWKNDREGDEELGTEEQKEEEEIEEQEKTVVEDEIKEEKIEAEEEITEEIEEEEVDDKSTVIEEKASGDKPLATETFNLSIETPILHQVFDEPNDIDNYSSLEEVSISEISHDVEDNTSVKSASEAPTLVQDVDSKRTSPDREDVSLDFAQVGEEPESWKPAIGQIYSVVITYAKDPSDFYIVNRPRSDEDTISAKLKIWWAEVKANPDIYVKPANVVPGLPVGVIRSPSRIERGVVVSLACDKPNAEVRLVDRGVHDMVPFSRLCYISKTHLIDEYPAAAVRCSVDARTNKFLDDGTPIWPPKVMGSLRKAVDTAAPYNAIFYSFDGEKYVTNLYVQKYECDESKSLLFHVIKHLGKWNLEDQQSPTLSAAGSFAIPAVVQEVVRRKERPIEEDRGVGFRHHPVAVAAIPVVPATPPKPFPSCGFPPIPR